MRVLNCFLILALLYGREMEEKFLPGKEETWVNRELFLQKDAENNMDWICKKWGNFEEDGMKK